MAIYRDSMNGYALFAEEADKKLHPDEVIIKREFRDYYGRLIKQHCRVHRSMIPGLIADLEQFQGQERPPEKPMTTCPDCNGTKHYPGSVVAACSTCDSTGKVEDWP